ncbi:MAG: CopG family transcriptional regulator [Cyanobacteria bacterium J06627_8]
MDSRPTTTPIAVEVPVGLMNQANRLVDAGWFRDLDEIVIDALRRFLESHQEKLMEDFIYQDVEWGLAGDE